MSTQREQLTLAAKACGMRYSIADMCWYLSDGSFVNPWNPLTNDGDCARMEAQLGINVTWLCDGVESEQPNAPAGKVELYSWHAGDKTPPAALLRWLSQRRLGG